MADEYSRRRNRNTSNTDDFDWEAFDRETSGSAATPARRRKRVSQPVHSAPARKTPAKPAQSDASSKTNTKTGKKKKKKLTEKQIEFRRKLRTTVLVTIAVLVVVFAGMFVGMYTAVSREIRDMNIESLALNNNSAIYYIDKAGMEHEYETLQSDSNRIWVESANISENFKNAVVAIEDERFYQHNGVDIKRTLGATVRYAFSRIGIGESTYGGSTITQQVIKNITSENDFKATRKIKEMMRAIALEKQLKKDDILTMYCNIVYFANGCNGVEAAAQLYFGKSASELNLQEAASIAGITQYPSLYDPIANKANNVEKRNIVLSKMLELGYITEGEYQSARASELILTTKTASFLINKTSYFADQVVNDVINDLVKEKNYAEDFATRQVYNGGFKIYATVDPQIQDIMEDVFENTSNFPGGGAQSAMVISDPYTGEIKGIIGGLGEKTDIRGWNRATQSKRQPGSSIKPLSVYGPAIDLGKVTEVDVIEDKAFDEGEFSDGWKPKNDYNGYKGDMLVKEAIARSANIPAIRILQKVGISNSYGYLKDKFHLTTIQDGDKNYSSLALGGLTDGVTVKEMAAAYGVFVNSGKYITPYTYTKVTNQNGEVVLENHMNETQAMSGSAAFITADLLSGPVNLPYGTATGARLSSGMPTYGKTGTTDDNFDKWFVGFTPYYVGATWFGFDSPSSLRAAGITGNPCVSAWKMVFDRISANQPYKTLTKPSDVVEMNVCSISGKLPNSWCTGIKAYFTEDTKPKARCSSHAGSKEDEESSEKPTEESSAAPTQASDASTSTAAPDSDTGASSKTDSTTPSDTDTGTGAASPPGDSVSSGTTTDTGGGTDVLDAE